MVSGLCVVMMMYIWLLCVRFFSSLKSFLDVVELSVLVGLLVRRMCCLLVSVCVILMCCCWLFEILLGWCLFNDLIFSFCMVLWVILVVLDFDVFCVYRGSVIFLVLVNLVMRLLFWKMMVMWCNWNWVLFVLFWLDMVMFFV